MQFIAFRDSASLMQVCQTNLVIHIIQRVFYNCPIDADTSSAFTWDVSKHLECTPSTETHLQADLH